MILYESGGPMGGLGNLTRIHGSAVYKTILPAAISTGILIGFEFRLFRGELDVYTIEHPYAIGAFVAFFSFLLAFRLNFAYGRYWEGCTAVHQMMSKWLDCAINMGSYHYQSTQFDDIRPPVFGGVNAAITADQIKGRERNFRGATLEHTINSIRQGAVLQDEGMSSRPLWKNLRQKPRRSPPDFLKLAEDKEILRGKSINSPHPASFDDSMNSNSSEKIPIPLRFQDQFLKAGDLSYDEGEDSESRRKRWRVKQSRAFRNLTKSRRAKLPAPSLFLQETAHLISLMCAVALATLRNDIDQAASPIAPYVPGKPWPPVDPDQLSKEIKREYGESNAVWRWIYFCLGLSRSQKHRTMYHAARPFGVLGGVSDAEIQLLQQARGPYAKVALTTMWLQEFISREYMAGSTGPVASPIISRLYQFISDGIAGYNQARKIAYAPFVFPHGQITAFFSLVIIFVFPLLYAGFINIFWFACVMNFVSVLCFLGIQEVARELENPYQNTPNDLPLTTFQAQMNEALVTIYAGFHPDSWWEVIPAAELSEVDEA